MDYNTGRKKLVLPEYGRNIYKMVEYIGTIEDREERNTMANAVIQIMGNMNPHLRDINDFKHKLWDHLAIMSDFTLDIDFPYEIPAKETFSSKPRIVEYSDREIKFKHYGKTIELFIERACNMEDDEVKDALVGVIANHMKKSYLTWNKDTVDDAVILKDLELLSKGRLKVGDEFKLADAKEIMSKGKRKRDKVMRKSNHKQ